ncbi:hypothetical protein ACWT_7395 [Actinoplanes sp. SE50]|uniref:DUF6412 domain-containing protein n=1 Tax=unclassified Actinoplanes TaxID=2626549 RepID=UPI00023EE033|nr:MULTISPECIES: DUF6412 domain-containing protein [unclassified Actinoplanes]AEV88405.1 hypothetical protein ACPL_7525 [Actinoplanes sp. SE50/110]ATO86810.1 hypothetical protein ACWT_7395 [Actinoplanes sp. SE50]SLM04228.1 hypothetical protein ACSP50_7531 [Actinoplanes sp. SE50/110]
MLLLGYWALAGTALLDPGLSSGPRLVVALALVAAALVVAAVVAVPVPAAGLLPGVRAFTRRVRTAAPRLLDPGASGRPRPRAPTAYPAAA